MLKVRIRCYEIQIQCTRTKASRSTISFVGCGSSFLTNYFRLNHPPFSNRAMSVSSRCLANSFGGILPRASRQYVNASFSFMEAREGSYSDMASRKKTALSWTPGCPGCCFMALKTSPTPLSLAIVCRFFSSVANRPRASLPYA